MATFALIIVLLALAFSPKSIAAPGDLDTSFGTGGKVTTPIGGGNDIGTSMVLQSDGRIVIAGYSGPNSNALDFALARYNTNGSLDTTFNGTGKVTTDFGSTTDFGNSVALQSDGKIVVTGRSVGSGGSIFAVARYNANGSLDTTFNGTGKVTTAIGSNGDEANSVALQNDGKIVIAGYSYDQNSNPNFALARYNSTGSLDTSFNGTGKVTTAMNGYVRSVAVQNDGKIVVAGFSGSDFALVRYNANGSLDTTFNGTGKVTTSFGSGGSGAAGVVVQSDGKIIAAGHAYLGSNNFALLRYNSNGSLDTTFNGTGKVSTSLGSSDFGNSVTLQSNGKIIVAGSSDQGNSSIALVRYNADGSLDTTFNGTGKVTTAIANGALAASVAVQGDGKIVAAGQSTTGSNQDFALVRYLGDTSPAVIVAQPQSQAVTAGSNVTISVSATGIPAPSYQWQFNGVNITGATTSSLTLNNVQQASAGSYSAIVTNSYGQVTSAAARISLVKDLGPVAPAQPTYTAITPVAGKDSVVFITHGRTPSPTDWPGQVAWLTRMKNTIQANIPSNWLVLEYEWESESESSVFTVRGKAETQGSDVGRQLVVIAQTLTPNGRFEHVHLIGHSAGCALIDEAAKVIRKTFPNTATVIHTTFLDPYFGVWDGGRDLYGSHSDWSDSYFSYSPEVGDGIYPWTYGSMVNAHNVDVTWLDPINLSATNRSTLFLASTSSTAPIANYIATSTHGWPITFYQNTIPPIPGDRLQGYGNYGFPLSKEAGGWANHSALQSNNNPPVFLGGQGGYPQGTLPVNSAPVLDFSVVPHVVGQTGSVQFSASGFTATSGGTQLAPQQASSSGQVIAAAAAAPTYSPAWTSIPVDTASRVNFVKFDVSFTSQSGAAGLLTVFWNDLEIGQIDERNATPGNRNYTFAISSAYLDKSNSLGFRLDQFSGVLSSITVSNVAVGLAGLTTEHKLTMTNAAGGASPVLTLTGALGYTFIIETSTDLINWVQMAAVTLDTAGTSLLNDPSASATPKKFYRAVSP